MISVQSSMGFALSPQQKHLWLVQQTEGSHPFSARCALAIDGRLPAGSLERALRDLVERHEILRTRFEVPEGLKLPLQVVMEPAGAAVSRHDLSGLDDANAQTELDRLWSSPVAPSGSSTSVSATLIALSPTRHRLFLALPALCADAAGLNNLVADLVACLRFRCGLGEAPEEPLQYADLAEWQNDAFKSPDARMGREFWQQRSQDSACHPMLPFAAGQRSGGFAPELVEVAIAPETVAAVETLAGRWGGSSSLVWLGCWQALVARLCGERELSLGLVLRGRNYADLENVPGLFAKCVPLRCSLASELDLGGLVAGLRKSIGEMEKWQECFSWEEAGSAQAYLPVCFEEQPPLPVFRVGEATFSVLAREVHGDRFDLKLVVGNTSPQLHYDSSLLRQEDVRRLGDQLCALIDSLLREPEARIENLSMVGAGELRAMALLNRTESASRETTLVGRFEEQVALRAGEPAVIGEEAELTWSELDARANQLARYLIRLGVGPESLVGVLLDRSIEMVVALLGVLKAGGAYVPLDPLQPRERLAQMLQGISAQVLLTLTRFAEEPISASVRTVRLDGEKADIEHESAERPGITTAPQNLVYVLFTSGSTGMPKGVAVEQRQVLNYLDGIVPRLESAAGLHYAMVSTFAADLGNTVLFPALTTGGRLFLIGQDRAGDPEALAEYFEARGIDVLKIVPSHLQALLGAARPRRVIPRKRLVLGGEACPWDLVDRVRALRPECRVLNHYGPTETTVGVLVSDLQDDRRGPWASAPIGRPLANTQVHLVDRELRPVPWGALGEVYIGGAGLARGYVGRPDSTAERFLPDPFGSQPGGRLYRTGDLARLTPGGEVVFAGRADQQVKLRGFRIELGEIEATLRLHPAVQDAAVTARSEGPGGMRLVAYFVARPESLSEDDLRLWVRERLPEYMVPAAFVRLDAMPLSPNGKLDRRSLPAPEQVRPARAYVAPRGPIEEALARIWEEVLKVDRVGAGDNFFDLGGDSILSIQIVARASRKGMRLVPRQIFEKQTIAELALVVGTAEESRAESGLVTGPVPLTPIQRGFFEQELAEPHHYNQSVLLESSDRLRAPWIERAVRVLLAHHDALRLRFQRDGGDWSQTSSPDVDPAVTVLDLEALPTEARDGALQAAAAQVQTSLDLVRGPLFRTAVFDLGPERPDHLLFVAHHLTVDGVSWRILIEDFQTVYDQLRQGLSIDLPPKTTSFKQWAERLTLYSRSDALWQEADYWAGEERLSASLLLVDHPRGRNRQMSASSVEVSLDSEETRALLQEVPRVYGTQINDALLAALAESFAHWTGSRTLRIDLEGHGREEEIAPGADLSRTVGWFTSVYPVSLDLQKAASMPEALREVKEQLRAIPRRGIGYGVLRYLADEPAARRLADQPPAKVSFNYLGQLDQVLPSTSHLRLAALSAGSASSPLNDRRYLLQIVGRVEGGCLKVSFKYSSEIHRRETIREVAEAFLAALCSLIHDCLSPEAMSYTPSDFPEAGLNQEDLDDLLIRLGE